jgi:hypothetical protein
MGLLCLVFVHIICVQLYKVMGVNHSNMDHSIGGVPQGVFEGQFISLFECAIFIYENRFHV